MLNLLIDTCVWLDLAKDPQQASILGVLEELVDMKEVHLLVPQIIYTEFDRNRARIVKHSSQGLSTYLKQAKELLSRFGDPKKKKAVLEQLNDVDHRISGLGETVATALVRVDKLLKAADLIGETDLITLAAAKRAVEKRAPFHKGKNSMADAIIIETYAACFRQKGSAGQLFAFVTHNKSDFSATTGNEKQPHPDIATYFSRIKSHYSLNLAETIRHYAPEMVTDMMIQQEWAEDSRSLTEILEAIDEFTNKVWYNRHQNRGYRLEKGKDKIIEKEDFKSETANHTIVREIWEGAKKSAKRLEKQYGLDNLGPWDDFEWGMINGKLSALRWVLGEEWDSLYT
jgi:hypothetical protein